MRAILAGGGTGGHVIPALAIANQLKKDYSAEILFIGTARGIENRLVPAAGYPLQLVRVGALKNVSLTTRLKTAFDLPRAIWDASRMLNEFAPDVVIGVGGYASGPAMLAALVKHVPTLAFEPNVVPGFANRLVARFVSGAAVHFEETSNYFRHGEVTGVPVRQAFFEIPPKRGGTPTVLVFGGSQGAHAINQAMIRCLPVLQREAPEFTSFTRRASVTIMTRWRLINLWENRRRVSPARCASSSTTCRRPSREPIWSYADQARARSRRLPRPASRPSLCRSRARPTIINA